MLQLPQPFVGKIFPVVNEQDRVLLGVLLQRVVRLFQLTLQLVKTARKPFRGLESGVPFDLQILFDVVVRKAIGNSRGQLRIVRIERNLDQVAAPDWTHAHRIHEVGNAVVKSLARGVQILSRGRDTSGVTLEEPEKTPTPVEFGQPIQLEVLYDALGQRPAFKDAVLGLPVTLHVSGCNLKDFLEVNNAGRVRIDFNQDRALKRRLLLERPHGND